MWLRTCGKWSDSQFWNDLGSSGGGAILECWATGKPIIFWELSIQTPVPSIRYCAVVIVTTVVLWCFPLVQALGGATGSISSHLQLLHPEQGPLYRQSPHAVGL